MSNKPCATKDCTTQAAGGGKYCAEHSPRRAHALTLEQRILARTDMGGADQCWRWTGYISATGTLCLRYKESNVNARSYLFEEAHGPIPAEHRLERDCGEPACVNPSHHRLIQMQRGPEPKSPTDRFWDKVAQGGPGECWTWQGGVNNRGYGTFCRNAEERHIYAHRFAYELLVAPIPKGLVVDHICHTTTCVNPEHLRLGTQALNAQNRSGPPVNNKSGHLGVYFETRSQRWIAQVRLGRRNVLSKRFDNKEDAAIAAREARNKYFTFNDHDRV